MLVIFGVYYYFSLSSSGDYSYLLLLTIFPIALGIFLFFVARNLWKGRKWARLIVMIISVLGILASFGSLSPPGIIINLFIAGYLLFSKRAKEAFSQFTPTFLSKCKYL